MCCYDDSANVRDFILFIHLNVARLHSDRCRIIGSFVFNLRLIVLATSIAVNEISFSMIASTKLQMFRSMSFYSTSCYTLNREILSGFKTKIGSTDYKSLLETERHSESNGKYTSIHTQ